MKAYGQEAKSEIWHRLPLFQIGNSIEKEAHCHRISDKVDSNLKAKESEEHYESQHEVIGIL